jgi:hypothetical protein
MGDALMTVVLVGNGWAEDHHDVELMDEGGPDAGAGPAQ